MDNVFFMAVVLVIWIGVFLYLLRLERRVRDLENKE
ncbi:MAG: CcmD family protein [Armatimonadetes bacterium]|nr:CcmD family protein [Armatimonadota bacterium]